MLTDTKLLFGLRTSQEVTLTVTGQPGPQAPGLAIATNGQDADTVIAYDNGSWTVALPAGDHIVRMDAPGASWFDGALKFTLSAESTIVIPNPAQSLPPLAWVAVSGVVNDPKNPFPPLLASRLVPSPVWLCDTMQRLHQQLAPQRAAPDQRALPRGRPTRL